ncbi:diguanylate cyclase domain-containing protein [Paenibacillus tengchongensis]|uniref:diguanylate cyclase domain-containing protein n=1 Tax=Paenibacillus tengchongensis TaxID=2608684 RepID=UPI001651BFA7|nr:diguanylate cyclase [Paenibacillus tengchongensis]
MKISEFAARHQVTAKMLRHYDEIGVLKPSAIDPVTGYRHYEEHQGAVLNWVLILKNLGFPLAEIGKIVSSPVSSAEMVKLLRRKRIEIVAGMNEQLQKKYLIDRLIQMVEQEEFRMEHLSGLLDMEQDSVHELKKNMPNMEVFLESALEIVSGSGEADEIALLRFDIRHFKAINDRHGFETGDKVILACYELIRQCLERTGCKSSTGRAHGDEFVACIQAAQPVVERLAAAILDSLENLDYRALGCAEAIGGRIGYLYAEKRRIGNIRRMIENSIDAVNEAARQDEMYAVYSEAFA